MRTRPDHREAVARRLELLRAELDPDRVPPTDGDPWAAPVWDSPPVLELVPDLPDRSEPPLVPVPGRHAARRSGTAPGWLRRAVEFLPGTVRGSVGLGPWHLAVLAIVVAAGLAATSWWVMRGDPETAPVASGTVAPLVSVGPTSGAPASTASPAAPAAASVTIDVAGKVRHPGVLELPAGSRVVDALEAAGGLRPGADLTGLNRARLLVDGEQIVVGAPAPAGAPRLSGSSGAAGASRPGAAGPGTLVNLNTASLDELDTLPEVGPVTAQAILDYRTEHGGFGSVDELLDIEGIGEKTLEKIAPHVTV